MSYEFYKLVHLSGVILLFVALGGVAVRAWVAAGQESEAAEVPGRALFAACHGISMLLLLVAGFGLLARLGISAKAPWVIGKLVVWLALGAAPSVLKRKPGLAKPALGLLVVLGAVAASLAVFKPGM